MKVIAAIAITIVGLASTAAITAATTPSLAGAPQAVAASEGAAHG